VSTGTAIRRARQRELPRLQEIERAAGGLFRQVGMAEVAEKEPRSLVQLEVACAEGRLFAADAGGEPIGFALMETVDGLPHLAELAVHPEHGRRGVGRRLVEFVCAWAARAGQPAVTLSTFRDVPWNRPFYERLGFRVLSPGEWTPGLRALRERESEHGLDVDGRDLMRRALRPDDGPAGTRAGPGADPG
jgi:GNAT superfamily N-acetyltransferase